MGEARDDQIDMDLDALAQLDARHMLDQVPGSLLRLARLVPRLRRDLAVANTRIAERDRAIAWVYRFCDPEVRGDLPLAVNIRGRLEALAMKDAALSVPDTGNNEHQGEQR